MPIGKILVAHRQGADELMGAFVSIGDGAMWIAPVGVSPRRWRGHKVDVDWVLRRIASKMRLSLLEAGCRWRSKAD
jgi:hypothetical protein